MADSVIGTFKVNAWNRVAGVTTIQGDFDSVYEPGKDGGGEFVHIRRPDGQIVKFKTPSLADWRLTVQDGRIAIRWIKIVDGGKELHLTTTDIPAGGLAGATVTGTNPAPPPPTGDTMDASEIRAIVKGEIKPVLDSLDSTWDDLKNRIVALGSADSGVSPEEIAQIAQAAADRVLLGEPQADHYGLPVPAQMGTRFQETIGYMLFNPAFLEAFLLRAGEVVQGMKDRGVIPGGTK
jgi:hypothetical protein